MSETMTATESINAQKEFVDKLDVFLKQGKEKVKKEFILLFVKRIKAMDELKARSHK